MGALLKWFDRKFSFDYPVEWHPDIVERFRSLPARLEDKIRRYPRNILTRRDMEGTWSIQENIGHLLDLEPLFQTRINEFLAGKDPLSPADVSNRATHEAGHNLVPVETILASIRKERLEQAAALDRLKTSDFARVSTHPRLKQKLRLVDAVYFVCCHDDYHLTRMSELAMLFGVQTP
jgi:uncharacterized damage-inducible protein DinB